MIKVNLISSRCRVLGALFVSTLLLGCGTGEKDPAPVPVQASYTISGTVSGATQIGVTINLTGASTKSITTDANGKYSFVSLSSGNYLVTPVKTGFIFSPGSATVGLSNADISGTNFTSSPLTYSLTGTVTGDVKQNVLITLNPGGLKTTTNSSGIYSFAGLANGNYTATPSLTDYTFSPADSTVTISNGNATADNFVSTLIKQTSTYSISGKVTGASLAGVAINLTGAVTGSTQTDATGSYQFSGLPNGSYTLSPVKTGIVFNPANASVSVNNSSINGINFNSSNLVVGFVGSGTVTGDVLQNVLITLSGSSIASTLTDSSGHYSFSALANGNYTAIPTLTGYSFSPVSIQISVLNANVTFSNFVAKSTSVIQLPKFDISTITDPLAKQQWGLLNTGQNGYADNVGVANTGGTLGTDINVNPVYVNYGYTGKGVIVAVVDSGMEIGHEDLSPNVVAGGSWNFINSTTDPTNSVTTGDHGTEVSGLIAMARNGKGGLGVASSAQLKGFNYISAQSSANSLAALGGSTLKPNSSDVSIFNQSFGTSNTSNSSINSTLEAQYAYGTSTLRGGKGALYVKSAGNGFKSFGSGSSAADCSAATPIGISCQNANFDPSNTLPYNIVMAALSAKGKKSSYSSAGSSIWASTPGGEYGYNAAVRSGLVSEAYDPAMVTTDQSGCSSGASVTSANTSLFSKGGINLGGINSNCNYTNNMNGTSSAAPMMTGVIALMLEANPLLTWREVKDILARTAVQVDAAIPAVKVNLGNGVYEAEQAWITNKAGLKFHNWYGFGAVNANSAINMALTYPSGSLGTFMNTGWIDSGTLSSSIPDNSITGASFTFQEPAFGAKSVVETVQLKIITTGTTIGNTQDLGIELISPSGTRSILKNIRDGLSGAQGLFNMVFASNAFYGEYGIGAWTVRVVDGWSGGGAQTLNQIQIRIYGH